MATKRRQVEVGRWCGNDGVVRCTCGAADRFVLRKTHDGRAWAVCWNCDAEHDLASVVAALASYDASFKEG